MAELYDRMTKVPEFSSTLDVFPEPILAFLDSLKPGLSFLDVGPGKGKEAALADRKGLEVTGLDLSPKMLEVFKKNVPRARAILGNATELPFEKEEFDVVFSTSCILHLDRTAGIKALSEFFRVLKQGGTLFLMTTLGDGIEELNERPWLKKAGIESWYFYHWQKGDLLEQIQKSGFKVLTLEEERNRENRPKILENRPIGSYLVARK